MEMFACRGEGGDLGLQAHTGRRFPHVLAESSGGHREGDGGGMFMSILHWAKPVALLDTIT